MDRTSASSEGREYGSPQTCHSSSGVEHPIRNRAVVSSILTCGSDTFFTDDAFRRRFLFYEREVSWVNLAGVIQLVECQLPKLDVAGSSPVARSRSRC